MPLSNLILIATFVLGFVNGILQDVVSYAQASGPVSTIMGTAGISAAVFVAFGCAVALQGQASARRIDWFDLVLIVAVWTCALLPISQASWAALTLLAGRVALSHRFDPFARSASAIILSICASLFWGRLLLHFVADEALTLDAHLVALLLGLKAEGNLITTGHGFSLSILKGCSSLQSISLGFMCWLAFVRLQHPMPIRGELAFAAALIPLAVIVNIMRLCCMTISERWLELMHGPIGGNGAGWIIIAGACALGALTLRRPQSA